MADTNIKTETDVGAATTAPKTPSTPKKRAAPKAEGSAKKARVKIASSYEDLNNEDKELLRLRDEEQLGWPDIDRKFEASTGKKPAASTLRKRYGAIKASIARVEPKHFECFKQTFKQVNAEIEAECKALKKKIWSRVSDVMAEQLTDKKDKYDPATLEKEWKKVETSVEEEGGAEDADNEDNDL